MKISVSPPVHLTYCLNVHPGESWAENFEAIRTFTLQIRDRAAPGMDFGLGLRLSRRASDRLISPQALGTFKSFLNRRRLYVLTINGFPYGTFHGERIKEQVYQPDWRSDARVDYTIRLAHILAALLPESLSGSISTVPCAYKSQIRTDADRNRIVQNLSRCAAELARIMDTTGREIHIGLEPEPDCFIETTKEAVSFFTQVIFTQGSACVAEFLGCSKSKAESILRRHIGICFDTCHLAMQFEDLSHSMALLTENDIRVSKLQISAALITEKIGESLNDYIDPVYLHQVKGKDRFGNIHAYKDLSDLMKVWARGESPDAQWRIHFHVPLYFEGDDDMGTTANELTPDMLHQAAEAGVDHCEIETYTFDVLPERLRKNGIVDSVAGEYDWVLEKWRSR